MTTTDRTLSLSALYTGLALTVIAAVAPFATTGLLAEHIRTGYPSYSADRIDTAVTTYLVILAVVGGLGVVGWLTTTWAVSTGRAWARWAVTAMFATGTLIALVLLLTEDTSGDVGLAPALGWTGLLPSLAGAVAVAAVWRTRTNPKEAKR